MFQGVLGSLKSTINKGFGLVADINVDGGTRGIVGNSANTNPQNALSGLLFGKAMPIIQVVVVFVLVLAAMFSGCKLAASAILEVPGSRARAIIGLIACLIGAVIVFNAQAIIALMTTMVL